MANYVRHHAEINSFHKKNGTLMQSTEEIFSGLFENCSYVFEFTFWADSDCVLVMNRGSNYQSRVEIEMGESITFSNMRPFETIEIEGKIGTKYKALFGC